MKLFLLKKFKMPKIVGILAFNIRINTASACCKARKCLGFQIFTSNRNFMLSWVEHEKSCITSGPGI